LAGTDTVQFIEAAAWSAFWVKLNALPAASTAFAPARPARFAALFGGMAKSAAVAGVVAAAEPDADGQGAAAAELAAAGALAAGALAAGALAAGALAAGALAAGALAAAAGALAAAEAHEPRADCAIVVELPPETAIMIPSVRPSAIGMARGTAIRAARLLLPRRRRADRCPLSIQSTSMDVRLLLPVHHRRPAAGPLFGISPDSRFVWF
jgi:hypothetical protein